MPTWLKCPVYPVTTQYYVICSKVHPFPLRDLFLEGLAEALKRPRRGNTWPFQSPGLWKLLTSGALLISPVVENLLNTVKVTIYMHTFNSVCNGEQNSWTRKLPLLDQTHWLCRHFIAITSRESHWWASLLLHLMTVLLTLAILMVMSNTTESRIMYQVWQCYVIRKTCMYAMDINDEAHCQTGHRKLRNKWLCTHAHVLTVSESLEKIASLKLINSVMSITWQC